MARVIDEIIASVATTIAPFLLGFMAAKLLHVSDAIGVAMIMAACIISLVAETSIIRFYERVRLGALYATLILAWSGAGIAIAAARDAILAAAVGMGIVILTNAVLDLMRRY